MYYTYVHIVLVRAYSITRGLGFFPGLDPWTTYKADDVYLSTTIINHVLIEQFGCYNLSLILFHINSELFTLSPTRHCSQSPYSRLWTPVAVPNVFRAWAIVNPQYTVYMCQTVGMAFDFWLIFNSLGNDKHRRPYTAPTRPYDHGMYEISLPARLLLTSNTVFIGSKSPYLCCCWKHRHHHDLPFT